MTEPPDRRALAAQGIQLFSEKELTSMELDARHPDAGPGDVVSHNGQLWRKTTGTTAPRRGKPAQSGIGLWVRVSD